MYSMLSNLEINFRVLNLYKLNQNNKFFNLILIVVGSVLQTVAEYLPLVAWLIWPFIVYFCMQTILIQRSFDWGYVKYCSELIAKIEKKGEVLTALMLYGILNLIIYRAIMECFGWLRLEADFLPNEVLTIFPFTVAQFFSYLFIAQCASKLSFQGNDPFNVLNLSLRDLFFSPISILILLIFQTLIFSYFAIEISLFYRMPDLSTFLGHAPFSFLVLVWVCGQPIEKDTKSLTEN